MDRSSADAMHLKLDDWRVRQHFRRVEAILRARDVGHLPLTIQQARQHHLDHLHAYAARGIFPRNYEHPGYAPCFIDRDGRECAVAHLVIFSGHTKVADQIASAANYAYVPQMAFPELDDWAAQSGFSREELALIQPGYWLTFSTELLLQTLAVWAVAAVILLINWVQMRRQRKGLIAPVIGFVTSAILLLIGLFFLWEAEVAYDTGTRADGWPYNLPLRDVPPLAVCGLVSLVLMAALAGLSGYRLRAWVRGWLRSE